MLMSSPHGSSPPLSASRANLTSRFRLHPLPFGSLFERFCGSGRLRIRSCVRGVQKLEPVGRAAYAQPCKPSCIEDSDAVWVADPWRLAALLDGDQAESLGVSDCVLNRGPADASLRRDLPERQVAGPALAALLGDEAQSRQLPRGDRSRCLDHHEPSGIFLSPTRTVSLQ
jgi:hypothetical protein